MKVTMLWPNLSDNPVVRSFPFAKIASALGYEVEIIGAKFGRLFEVYLNQLKDDENITLNTIQWPTSVSFASPIRLMHALFKTFRINGDIVHVFKTWPNTLIPGIFQKYFQGKRVLLDIEDYHSIYRKEKLNGLGKTSIFSKDFLVNYNIYFMHKIFEGFSNHIGNIIVSTHGLQKIFGGIVIPTCIDTDFFNPERFDLNALKKRCGLEDKVVISFMGTPRPFKGVEILIEAYKKIQEEYSEPALLLVGGSLKDEYVRSIHKRSSKLKNVYFKEFVPHDVIPEFLAISDIFVVPQLNTKFAKVQLPAKVFDGMAMEKAVIGTDVSDLPTILDGCGLIAKAGSVNSLYEKLRILFDDEKLRIKLGKKARKKCVSFYSWHWLRRQMKNIYEDMLM